MDDAALLDLWSRASDGTTHDRAESLAAAWGGGGLAIGDRNRVLLAALPEQVGCVADCPGCGEALELDLSPADLLTSSPCRDAGRARPPTAEDLRAAAACASVEEARAVLAARCTGAPVPPGELAEVGEALDAADPLLAPTIPLECDVCGQAWGVLVEPGELLWAQLDARARGLAAEVAELAREFGWSEAEVMALPRARRRLYQELAG